MRALRYTYRIRPGKQAKRALLDEWHRCRFLWNEAVYQQVTGRRPTFCKLSKLLTEARNNCEWLKTGAQVVQQQTLRTYAIALQHSFNLKNRGVPKVKSRKTSRPSLEYTVQGFSIKNRHLVLAKGISVPVVWSRELPTAPSSVRIFRDSLNNWYASFSIRHEDAPLPRVTGTIGIDWGVLTAATTTNPEYDLTVLGHHRRCAAELARTQRKMARRFRHNQRPTNGYIKARRQVAKVHKKASRQNKFTSRQWAQRVVKHHQFIAVEDLKLAFLQRSTMSRKLPDLAIGMLKRMLIECGQRAGREVVLVSPAYTTKTCSNCFARTKQQISLSTRTFICSECNYTNTRDRNAARVILAMAERNHAGAESVRHAASNQHGMLLEPKIFASP